MIRFTCPRCQATLEAKDSQSGAKVACSKCQQRLQVPVLPPVNKTILVSSIANSASNVELIGHPAPAKMEPHAPISNVVWMSSASVALALVLAVSAVLATVAHQRALGIFLAALSVAFALLAVAKAFLRRGMGTALVTFLVAGGLLFSLIAFVEEGQKPKKAETVGPFTQAKEPAQREERKEGVEPRPERRDEEPSRRREPEEKQPAGQEAEPPLPPQPAKKGPILSNEEFREFVKWLEGFRNSLGDPADNPLRYADSLQKAKQKAFAYSTDYARRRVLLGINCHISKITEDGVYLIPEVLGGEVFISFPDHMTEVPRGDVFFRQIRHPPILLKINEDIPRDEVLKLQRGQNLNIKGTVTSIKIEEPEELEGTPIKIARFNRHLYVHVKISLDNLRVGKANRDANIKTLPSQIGVPLSD